MVQLLPMRRKESIASQLQKTKQKTKTKKQKALLYKVISLEPQLPPWRRDESRNKA
jgi:hypothetical protein